MNAAAKTLDAMRNNPRDWRMPQLLALADRLGIEVRNRGGNHHFFSSPLIAQTLCVSAHKPVKPAYIKQFVAFVEALALEQEKRK